MFLEHVKTNGYFSISTMLLTIFVIFAVLNRNFMMSSSSKKPSTNSPTPRRSARLSSAPQSSQVNKTEPEMQIIGRSWKPTEKRDLLNAMKKYGCSDIHKLARGVKSRSPNEIKEYLKKNMDHVRNNFFDDLNKAMKKEMDLAAAQKGQENGITASTQNAKENGIAAPQSNYENAYSAEAQSYDGGAIPKVGEENVGKSSKTDGATATNTEDEHLKLLSMMNPTMLWKQIITSNIAVQHRADDYSSVLADMFKVFGEQTEDLNIPDGPNFKVLYKFLEDTLNGITPAELSPPNASMLDYLLFELNNFIKDEGGNARKFIEEFDGPSAFAPVSVCTNLKSGDVSTSKPVSKSLAAAALKSIAGKRKDQIIPVPDEDFEHYWRHQKIKENLNPLGVPPWLMQEMNEKIVKCIKTRFPKYNPSE